MASFYFCWIFISNTHHINNTWLFIEITYHLITKNKRIPYEKKFTYSVYHRDDGDSRAYYGSGMCQLFWRSRWYLLNFYTTLGRRILQHRSILWRAPSWTSTHMGWIWDQIPIKREIWTSGPRIEDWTWFTSLCPAKKIWGNKKACNLIKRIWMDRSQPFCQEVPRKVFWLTHCYKSSFVLILLKELFSIIKDGLFMYNIVNKLKDTQINFIKRQIISNLKISDIKSIGSKRLLI